MGANSTTPTAALSTASPKAKEKALVSPRATTKAMESPSEKALDVAKDSERKARATPRKALGREDFGPKSFLTAFRTTTVDPT